MADLKERRVCVLEMKWRSALAANRFTLKIPTAIRLSCSSPLAIEESPATRIRTHEVTLDAKYWRPQMCRNGRRANSTTDRADWKPHVRGIRTRQAPTADPQSFTETVPQSASLIAWSLACCAPYAPGPADPFRDRPQTLICMFNRDRDERGDARRLVRETLDWLREGHQTADLKAAREVLRRRDLRGSRRAAGAG